MAGCEDASGYTLSDQLAPRSVRATRLAQRWDERRRTTILRLVQVPVLAFRVRPAGRRQGTPDLHRIPADAEKRELQPRGCESRTGEKDGPGGSGSQRHRSVTSNINGLHGGQLTRAACHSVTRQENDVLTRNYQLRLFSAAAVALGLIATVTYAQEALPSWNDGPAKQAILEFVKATTAQGSAQFVPPETRIATFDQDGTLWVEHPMYTQVTYCLERVPDLVKAKPELKNKPPFNTVLEWLHGDRAAMEKLNMKD